MENDDRRLLIYAAIAALAAATPAIYSFDLGALALSFVLTVVAAIVLFVTAASRKGHRIVSILSVTIVFTLTFGSLIANLAYLHPAVRWTVEGPIRKIQLHDGPLLNSDRLTHVEWDGWGFAGAETTEYLVFDPSDSLASAAARVEHRAPSIPCPFARARLLEQCYYAVTFYTNTDWSQCEQP